MLVASSSGFFEPTVNFLGEEHRGIGPVGCARAGSMDGVLTNLFPLVTNGRFVAPLVVFTCSIPYTLSNNSSVRNSFLSVWLGFQV